MLLSTQPCSALFLEPLDDGTDRSVRIGIVQGPVSILQNDAKRKTLFFI
jgi:hypothetical protein